MTEELNEAAGQEELPPPLPEEEVADATAGDIAIAPDEIDTADDAARGVGPEEVARLVAEAEQRGYLRARNEMAQAEMEKPDLLSNPALSAVNRQKPEPGGGLAAQFLSELPRRVWD